MTQTAPLCGFLNVLKPPGCSSAAVVGHVRWLLHGQKVGHAGTLDPEAAGVLPLRVGKAARLFDDLQDKERAYVAEIAFGAATDTQDAQGRVIETGECYPTRDAILAALPAFTGEIWQTPPMFSALKRDGRPLYQLAREGVEKQIEPRQVTVGELALLQMTGNHGALLKVRCSKGFYVRTLCHDLGHALGCPAHMRFLLRTQSGPFTLEGAMTLEAIGSAVASHSPRLIPPEEALSHMPRAVAPKGLERAATTGGRLPWNAFGALRGTKAEAGAPFLLWLNGRLLGVAVRQGEQVRLRTWLYD